ncbi:MAG TPA: alpha/beta hydrolase [Candidatus Acidoferrales bacterium]|nr:alpha/beta hydrolase [Candidatus Acidoferrales bacterium]
MPVISRDGVRLHYEDIGIGPAVLWHTGGGGDGTMWRTSGYLDELPGRRHLLLDHRGHGRSDQPQGLEAHRLDEYMADVLAVLDAAGVDQAAMVGYSDGGRVIYALAARHPERVAAVVGIGGVSLPQETYAWRRELAREVRQMGFRSWLEQMSESEAEAAPAWLMNNLAATSTEMFALEVEAWADAPSESSHFPHIEAPTLIICGEDEDADGAAELAVKALPSGKAVVLPGFGHLQAFWRSETTAPIIRDFLAAG